MQPGGREGERESSLLLKTFWHKVINKETKIKKRIFFSWCNYSEYWILIGISWIFNHDHKS